MMTIEVDGRVNGFDALRQNITVATEGPVEQAFWAGLVDVLETYLGRDFLSYELGETDRELLVRRVLAISGALPQFCGSINALKRNQIQDEDLIIGMMHAKQSLKSVDKSQLN